jgi:hypothetical protein
MSHHIIFGSHEWPIPERLPAGLVARLSVGDQQGAFIELLGEEGYRALCDWGATVEEAAFLWRGVEKLYGIRFRRRADIRIHRQAEELAAGGRRVQVFGLRLIARTVWPRQRGRPKGSCYRGQSHYAKVAAVYRAADSWTAAVNEVMARWFVHRRTAEKWLRQARLALANSPDAGHHG